MIKNDLLIPDINGESLKNARVKSLASKADLAKQLCLSVAHINELETGELKVFFNYRHKYFTALKLGKLLGLSEADIIKSRSGQYEVISDSVDTISPAEIGVGIVAKCASKTIPKPRFGSLASSRLAKTEPSFFGFSFMRCQKLFILLTCAGIGFSGASFLFGFDGNSIFTSQSSAKIDQDLPRAPVDHFLVEHLKADEPASPATPSSALGANEAIASNNSPIAMNVSSANCQRAGDGRTVQFTPIEPLKPSNFVYIRATQPSALCIEDSTGKMVKLNLGSNEFKVVGVKAPLTIFSSNFSDLQIYFQGRKVDESAKAANELILNPVEFVQQDGR